MSMPFFVISATLANVPPLCFGPQPHPRHIQPRNRNRHSRQQGHKSSPNLRPHIFSTSGEVPHSELILKHLRSPEPFSSIGSWGALGWQEVILPYGNPNGPALGRKWVPLVESLNDTTAEYP
jgi:hypothetical protein